jgi:hypothetical protein
VRRITISPCPSSMRARPRSRGPRRGHPVSLWSCPGFVDWFGLSDHAAGWPCLSS